jgi:hypothetical protein
MTAKERTELIDTAIKLFISLIFVGIGVWFLLTGRDDLRTLGAGFLGGVIGYWLK